MVSEMKVKESLHDKPLLVAFFISSVPNILKYKAVHLIVIQ